MKIAEIIFSPTGGTKRVADILVEKMGECSRIIDLSEPTFSDTGIDEEELAVIAVPSYGGRVPALATGRISKIKGNHAKCVIVCVYGNRAYEDTLVELEDIATQSGFQVIAAVAAVAEHSIMHQYAAGRPDQQDIEELEKCAEQILEKLESGGSGLATVLPGNRPYKKTGVATLVPKAANACNGCGLCAEQCPAQAIKKERIKTADSKLCISCMRCVAQCPQHARKVNEAMVSAVALAIKKACIVRKECELYL